MPGPVNLRDPQGNAVSVPEEQVGEAIAKGFTFEDVGGETDRLASEARTETYGGLGGKAVTFGANLASGATLGLSDVGLSALGDGEDLRQYREENPLTAAAGQVIGGLAPALVPGGYLARTPAGYLARIANEGVDLAQSARGVKALAGTAAISGAEGAAQNAGMYLSDVALGDRELTAEGMAGALGRGFAFGGVAGGATYGIQQGTMAARRMFSRTAEGGRVAAEDAAAAFERKSDEILTAHDDAYAIARKRYDDIQAAKAQAMEMRARAQAEISQARLDDFRTPTPEAPTNSAGTSTRLVDELAPTGASLAPEAGVLPEASIGGSAALEAPAAPAVAESPAAPAPAGKKPRKRKGAPESPATAATGDAADSTTALERQLTEMKGQVDAGASLQDLNAARTAQPSVANTEALLGPKIAEEEAKLGDALSAYEQRRAKVNDWVARLKNPRKALEADPLAGNAAARGQAPAVRGRRTEALAEDVFVEQSGGQLRTIGKMEHSLDDLTANSRILARSNGEEFSRGSQLDELYDDAIERAAMSESRKEMDAALHEAADIEKQIHGYVRKTKPENAAVIDKIEALRESAGVGGYEAAFKRAEIRANRASSAVEPRLARANPEQEAFYQETLAGQGPRGPVDTSWLSNAERQGAQMRGEPFPAKRTEAPSFKRAERPESSAPASASAPEAAPAATPAAVGEAVSAKPKNVLDDVHEAAEVLGDYEKAAADLTEAVGDAAPPKAKETAEQFRKAESEVDRKHMDRTARAIDDEVTHGPVQRTPKERIYDAQGAKLQAEADIARLKIDEMGARHTMKELKPPKVKAKAAKEPAAPEPVAAEPGRAGMLADIGAVLEAANTIGIPGLPKPSDIPLVGPVLGLYLKARALKAVAGRMTGRVAATGDARAAALAAKTKERVTQSVDRLLGLVERKAMTARSYTVAGGGRTAEILAKRLFDDGDDDAGEGASAQKLCAVRIRELGAAVANPNAVIANVRKELRDVTDPDLIAAAEKHELRKLQHLHDVAPKAPPPNPYAPREWMPDATAAARFARRLEVAEDPDVALQHVEQGTISTEAADTLRAVFPKLFVMLQQRLLERTPDLKQAIPFQQRLRMSRLFDVPLDPLLEPETMATLHSTASAVTSPANSAQNQAPVPSTAAPVDLTALYQPAADRRAARR